MSCNYFFHELSADSFSLVAPQTIINMSTQWEADKMDIFGQKQEVCADDFDFDFNGDDEFDNDDLDDELEDLSDFYNDDDGEYSYDIEEDDEDFYDDDLDD